MGVVCSVCRETYDHKEINFIPTDPKDYYALEPVCEGCQEKMDGN